MYSAFIGVIPRCLLLLPLSALFASTGPGCSLHAQDFTGTYRVDSPNGVLELDLWSMGEDRYAGLLAQPDGRTYEAEGRVVIDDEDGARSVEGVLSSPQGGGAFLLGEPDEDGFHYLLLTPNDALGTPRPDQAAGYLVQRHAGSWAPSVPPPPPTARDGQAPALEAGPAGNHDPRLVGTWATQVTMHAPQGVVATQIFMELTADGRLVDRGSRAVGSFPGAGLESGLVGGGETMPWQTREDILLVSYAGSPWVPLARFEVSGDRLLLVYYDGDRKLWYRQ